MNAMITAASPLTANPIYYSGNATLTYTLSAWELSRSECGPLSYKAYLNGTEVPSTQAGGS